VLTTEQEKHSINHEKNPNFPQRDELDRLIDQVKTTAFRKNFLSEISNRDIPRLAIGGAIANGKVIEEGNCFRIKELITSILKIIRNVNFEVLAFLLRLEMEFLSKKKCLKV
jgi:hypothetical protein